jgi:alpha-tubulin suppressor-like RCC1 family protein
MESFGAMAMEETGGSVTKQNSTKEFQGSKIRKKFSENSRKVESLEGIVMASGGGCHSAAINSKGQLFTWGWNHFGQLGVPNVQNQSSPLLVPDMKGKKVIWVSCGEGHTLAIVS